MPTPESVSTDLSATQQYLAKAGEIDAFASKGLRLVDANVVGHVVDAARLNGEVIATGMVHSQERNPGQDQDSFLRTATLEFTKQAIFGVLGNPEVREQIYQVERAQRTLTGRIMTRLGLGRVRGLGMHNG